MLVYGKNVCFDILKENYKKVRKVYLEEGFKDDNLILLMKKLNIKPIILSKYDISKLASEKNQGIILDVVDFSYTDYHEFISDNESVVLILDHLEDPHNLGAIIRTVEASGISGIIIPKDRSASVNSTVYKTSAGTVDHVKIDMVTNLVNTINDLKNNGVWIVGTDMDNAIDYRKVDFHGKVAIVIGNEGKGMSRLVHDSCDFIAKIPMYGKVNSLNASVATSIIVYEALRQKGM